MPKDTAMFVIEKLQEQFQRFFPQEGLLMIRDELLQHSPPAILAAGDHLILNHTYLPSAAQLLERVKLETSMIRMAEARNREEEWARTKGVTPGADPQRQAEEMRRQGSIFSSQQQPGKARDALDLLVNIANMTKVQRVQAFQELDRKYPHAGFGLTAKETERIFDIQEHWRPVENTSPVFQHRHRLEMADATEQRKEARSLGLI